MKKVGHGTETLPFHSEFEIETLVFCAWGSI